MDVSVIVCTFNRSDGLRQTLATFCALAVPAQLTWEVLVVDNNSNDDTRLVCESFAGRLPLRRVHEPRQGLSRARNRAITEACGDLLLFTDDDVSVDSQWLAAYWNAAQQHPNIGVFGGKILPHWEITPPQWLRDNAATLLRPIAVHLDLGDKDVFIEHPRPVLWGPNMAFRKRVFTESIRFREDIGRRGQDEVRGGETDLIQRLIEQGHRRLYVAGAIVRHRNRTERATERYVFAYFKGAGITEVRVKGAPSSPHVWFGAPRYYWWKLVRSSVRYAASRATRPSRIWVSALAEMGRCWGVISELRRLRRNAGSSPASAAG